MKYLYNDELFDAEIEQDGKVGDLVITSVVREATKDVSGLRLHISNPLENSEGNLSDGDIVAQVPLEFQS